MPVEQDSILNELKLQIHLLRKQHGYLAHRMEEKLLIWLVSDTILESGDPNELLHNTLERISLILDLPCGFCYQILDNQTIPVAIFKADAQPPISGFKISQTVIEKINDGPLFIPGDLLGKWQLTFDKELPTNIRQISLFPFQSLYIPFGVFVFFEEISGKSSLTSLKSAILHLISFAVQRFEKLSLLKELKELNYSFESKVRLRTREIKANYEKLQKENKDLRKKLKKLKQEGEKVDVSGLSATDQDLMHNIGMEIRTPLNGIMGFAEMLRDDSIKSKVKNHYIDIIRSCGKSLMRMVDDSVVYSTLISGGVELNRTEFAVAPFLSQFYDQYKTDELLRSRENVDLKLNINTPVNQLIFSDKQKLNQILDILTSNAIKFTGKGVIEIGSSISDKNIKDDNGGGPRLILFVKDSGVGIDPAIGAKVFEPFYKIEHETSELQGGIGLGLTIARIIIQILGGELWFESEKDAGSAFYMSIPGLLPIIEDQQPEKSIAGQSDEIPWADKQFLIVEDDEMSYIYLKEVLKPSGVKIIRAKTGSQAVDIFRDNPDIDLVLMDIKLPDINGYEVTRLIKEIRNVPVIAQTAYAMADDQKKSIESGCDGYIAKPINRKQLMMVIDHLLAKRDIIEI